MDKIELKNLLFLARIHAEEKEYPEITKKFQGIWYKKRVISKSAIKINSYGIIT